MNNGSYFEKMSDNLKDMFDNNPITIIVSTKEIKEKQEKEPIKNRKKFVISKVKRVFHSTNVDEVNEKLREGWYLIAFTKTHRKGIEYALGCMED